MEQSSDHDLPSREWLYARVTDPAATPAFVDPWDMSKQEAAAGGEEIRYTDGGAGERAAGPAEAGPLVGGLQDDRFPVRCRHGDEDPVAGVHCYGIDARLAPLLDPGVVDGPEEAGMRRPVDAVRETARERKMSPLVRSVAERGRISCHARAMKEDPDTEMLEEIPCGTNTRGFSQYRTWENAGAAAAQHTTRERRARRTRMRLLMRCSARPRAVSSTAGEVHRSCSAATADHSRSP